MKTMDQAADQVPRVIRWIVERDLDPAGAPLLRYRRIDMESDPAEQPDLRLWRTELAFRLRD